MDSVSIVVLVVEILLLMAGWLLFQQAKSDLTARAAQAPVLSEVKALQKSIAGLLEQLKLESAQSSAQLEARCIEARDLLAALDRRLDEALPRDDARKPFHRSSGAGAENAAAITAIVDAPRAEARYKQVYDLADQGVPLAEVAQQSGYSEGEVELILGLRQSVAQSVS